MRLELTGRQVEITPALRRLVDKKLARVERMLNDSAVSAQVVLTRLKRGCRADLALHARGEKFLHGVGEGVSWEASLSLAVEKLAQQAQTVKGKWAQRRRRGLSKNVPPAAESVAELPVEKTGRPARPQMPRVLRTSRQAIRPMSVADAARVADASGNGVGVVVFRDIETSWISVVYRAADGELTLVQTET